jgi:Kdo2-lipid IVA lauroyltransferase/acyltransferase
VEAALRAPAGERLAAGTLRLAARGLERLPAPLAYGCADALLPALLAWGLAHELRAGRRGRGARRNLRIAYREALGRGERWRLLARHARHLAHLGVDLCRMPRLDAARLERHVDFAAIEPLRSLLARGRGLVCVSGHVGVWELLGHAASVRGLRVTVVVRRPGAVALDALLMRLRTSGGQRCAAQRGGLAALRSALARGEIAGLLADEDAGRGRLFAPFLGTLAASSSAAAWLQLRSGAPIAVLSCERTARERYRIRLWRVIEPAAEVGPVRRRRVTAEINAALGAAIRAAPAQWLWGSRRFATRPPGERAGADGLPPRADDSHAPG